MPSNYNESTGQIETLHERYTREAAEYEARAVERRIAEAVAAERDACAKVCDLLTMGCMDDPLARAAERCARVIRARNDA